MKKEGLVFCQVNYVPDITSGLGVKTMIKFSGTASADSF
jgi:hypothetical protein